MIPRLLPEDGLDPEYRAYLTGLRERGFEGEIRTDYATRLVTATDNSVYQVMPQAVLFPQHAADVQAIFELAHESDHRAIKLSPRGGGTGTNGQSLCNGIIVDLARHMAAILEVDLEAGWVRVQPGVVLDQLNAELRPHRVFFAPSLSPSNRATLGGMIATDACGKGSRIYGKTSEHILELEVVLIDGTRFTSRPVTQGELAEIKQRNDLIGHVHRVVDDVVTRKRTAIAEHFPKLKRFLTGYNLAHVYSADRGHFNLNAILAGAEGTLAVVTEAKLKLTPLPSHRKLVAVRYADFDAALRAANVLVQADPGAIETVDDTIVDLARHDAIWRSIAHLVQAQGEPAMKAINLVEFESHDPAVVDRKVDELTARLDAERGQPGRSMGYTVATAAVDIAALWGLRKKGVGLLGAAKGSRRPIPFVEDTVVPPEHLADYIREFRALLDGHGLTYGMFGHVDVGCLHVRPALNLRDPADEALLRQLSDGVCALVQKYGGVLWGEHGKGYRSEYSPVFFGPELYAELRQIKSAFDPHNQLNPGKLATPLRGQDKLVSVDAVKRGAFDRQIEPNALVRYDVAVNCNGNGACFDWDPDHVMCPSSKVTRDRIHSPKGRAGMMREWLRQVARAGFDVTEARPTAPSLWTSRASTPEDFSHEVYDAMNGCLACKACATQCPIKVDVPAFRADFLHHYHARYRRPLRDYVLAALEPLAPTLTWFPGLTRAAMRSGWLTGALARWIGIVDPPVPSGPTLRRALRDRNAPKYDAAVLRGLSDADKRRSVLLVQDAFTSIFDSKVALTTYDFLTALGYRVYVLPYRENGKALHIKGFLGRFQRVVERNTAWLREAATTGISLVGLDPAVTLTYRDEYVHAMGSADLGFEVLLLAEWLDRERQAIDDALAKRRSDAKKTTYTFFSHCTERTAAPHALRQWQAAFARFGFDLKTIDVGCCGMCGVFGHEREHLDESRGVFRMSWSEHLARTPAEYVLTQGYSCRHQVERLAGFRPAHPIEVLYESLQS